MRAHYWCPLIEGCFYRPKLDSQEEEPTAKFYTEGFIKSYRASSPVRFSQEKKTCWLRIARKQNDNFY